MIQTALSKQKSQPASHFADNSQASPLRGSRSSVRYFALEFTIRVLTWQAWQKSPGSEI